MRYRIASAVLCGTLALSLMGLASPAYAICKKLGFTVNHYGKEGPTRDAKRLLDGYLESWTAERGIKKYRRKGEKTVSCYKFLDCGFFDEWTCKSVQEICFRGNKIPDVIAKKNKATDKAEANAKEPVKTAKNDKGAKRVKKYSKHYTRRMKYRKKPKQTGKKEG